MENKILSGSCKIETPEATKPVTGSRGEEEWGGASAPEDDVYQRPSALTPSAP